MSQPQFFRLYNRATSRRLAEWVHDEMDLEQVICPVKEGHMRGGKRLMDLSVDLRGAGVQDFVWTWYSECMIQDHVVETFRERGLTGFDVKPVKARFKKRSEQPVPRLWELVVTGWAGMAPPESGVRLLSRCEGCGYVIYSKFDKPERLVDMARWDGSDFFMVWPLPMFIFVTERVAQLIKEMKWKGAVLIPLNQFECNGRTIGKLGPGRLSDYMPESRARELGRAEGIAEI